MEEKGREWEWKGRGWKGRKGEAHFISSRFSRFPGTDDPSMCTHVCGGGSGWKGPRDVCISFPR